jgi:hypothetical protein
LADRGALAAVDTPIVPNKAKSLDRDAGARARRVRARGARQAAGGANRRDVLARLQQLWMLPDDLLCVIGNDGRIKMSTPHGGAGWAGAIGTW